MNTANHAAMHLTRSRATKPHRCFFSDRKTIKPAPKVHKPADSGVVVGIGARLCSFQEVNWQAIKQAASVESQETDKRATIGVVTTQ